MNYPDANIYISEQFIIKKYVFNFCMVRIYSSFFISETCTTFASKGKIGCASEIKMNGIHFVFHSACTTFAAMNTGIRKNDKRS